MEKLGVLGMGISGYEAAVLGVKLGCGVFLSDNREEDELSRERILKLRSLGVNTEFGKNTAQFFAGCSRIVLSPGISPETPIIGELTKDGHEFISNLDLAYENLKAEGWIGVTGTNGKTTTTDLLGKLLSRKYKTFTGGNIGTSPCSVFGEEFERVVLEISSYQLDISSALQLRGSIILNITEDHLNRYKTMSNYIASKKKIADLTDGYLILNREDEALYDAYKGRNGAIFVSAEGNKDSHAYLDSDEMIFNAGDTKINISANILKIPGDHNIFNAMCAVSSAIMEGVCRDDIIPVLEHYEGLEHRIEHIKTINGIRIFNDSKSTTPDSTLAAVLSFPRGSIFLIVGGSDEKNSDFTILGNALKQNCKAAYAVGETADRFIETVKGGEIKGPMTIEDALMSALRSGKEGDLILFSPGAPSFDRFINYKQRGDYFKKIVYEIQGN